MDHDVGLRNQDILGVQSRQNAPFVCQGQFPRPPVIPLPSRTNLYSYPPYNAYNSIAPNPGLRYNPMGTPWTSPGVRPLRMLTNSYAVRNMVPYATRAPPSTNQELKKSSAAIKIINPESGKEVLANGESYTQTQSNILTTPDVSGARETCGPNPGQIKPKLHESWPKTLDVPQWSANATGSSSRTTHVNRSQYPLPSPATAAGHSLPRTHRKADLEMEMSQGIFESQSEAPSSVETQHFCEDTTTAENFKRLMRLVQELTECPVCYEALTGDLIQCKNGHALCESCATFIDNCPSCGEEFAVQKSTLLGQILERLPKACPFSGEGCDHILFESEEHSSFCKYRPTSCKNNHCEWKGCAKDLIDHVRECFKDIGLCHIPLPNIKITRTWVINPARDISCYVPIIFENEIFWMYFHRSRSSKRISHKFYHIPTSKPTQKYYLIVSFAKGKLNYTCYFNASTDIGNDLKAKVNKSGFVFPDSELERFRIPGSKNTYLYTLEIVTEKIA